MIGIVITAVGLLLLAGIWFIITRALGGLIASETAGQVRTRVLQLIDNAVAHLPEGQRERYREEWRADLETLKDRPLSAIRWALQVRRCARRLADEFASPACTRPMLKTDVAQMFQELDEFLAARPFNRLFLVHGYDLTGIAGHTRRNPLSRSLDSEHATATLRLPVVWEPQAGVIPLTASDTPSTEEPDRLRLMIQNYVDGGGLDSVSDVRLVEWHLERPADELPSRGTARDSHWTVTATFAAS
jgi:hypothetical protein